MIIVGSFILLVGCLQSLHAAPNLVDDGKLELLILHNNDMHARFEQTSINGNKCSLTDVTANQCYGGFARVAHEVREYRKQADNGGTSVLYLNAGDTYTGTPWFQLYKENITSTFLNALKPDAISLGNHEFDEGTEILGKFLKEITFPVLVTNINIEKEPELNSVHLMKSTVFERDGHKIGVIGYLTPETKLVAANNQVEFEEEITAINKEAQLLHNDGVNIIIALGHSGLAKDKTIAAECVHVDLVIGGHSHSFLYTGETPSNDVPVDNYPVMITQRNGKKVPVVQAYAYTKYLGKLHLIFDSDGNLEEIDGRPMLLDKEVPRDEDVVKLLDIYRPGIDELEKKIVGSTRVALDGVCRTKECNLGNLICDSMVDWYSSVTNSGEFWTDASIAMLQGGGIRAGIDKPGNITMEDLLTILPFGSKIEAVELTGAELMEVLEHSVYRYENGNDNGEFLQFSGLNVVYDMNKPTGHRVADVKVACAKCAVPELVNVQLNEKYRIVVQDFLAGGGDGFATMIGKSYYQGEILDIDVVSKYLEKRSPVFPAVEWRVKFMPEILGRTRVTLDNNCEDQECNLGNFIADSMVDYYAQNFNHESQWTDASIALIQGSKILSSIPANSDIISDHVMSIFGTSKNLHVKELTGMELKKVLEFAISNDKFLQVSGLEVTFDMNKPVNEKVVQLKSLCTACLSPTLENVVDNGNYKVIMQNSLASGEDGFGAIYEKVGSVETRETDSNAFIQYLKKKSPIYPAVERRINVIEEVIEEITTPGDSTTSVNQDTTTVSTPTTTDGASSLVVSFTVLIFSMILSLKFE